MIGTIALLRLIYITFDEIISEYIRSLYKDSINFAFIF